MRYTFMIIILAVFAPSAVMAGHGKLPRKIMRDSLEVITRRCAEVLDGAYMTQKYLRNEPQGRRLGRIPCKVVRVLHRLRQYGLRA